MSTSLACSCVACSACHNFSSDGRPFSLHNNSLQPLSILRFHLHLSSLHQLSPPLHLQIPLSSCKFQFFFQLLSRLSSCPFFPGVARHMECVLQILSPIPTHLSSAAQNQRSEKRDGTGKGKENYYISDKCFLHGALETKRSY